MEVAELLSRARPVALAAERTVPVGPELSDLLPTGIRRGSTVGFGRGVGRTSLLLALLSAASVAGSWCALVGLPEVGPEAAASAGIDLGRLAWVPDPGERWATVVSTLLDGIDLVALRPPRRVAPEEARRLAAQARSASSVLLVTGSWPESSDFNLQVTGSRWEGLGEGHGCLWRRQAEVSLGGRRAPRRHRSQLWLPDETGRATSVVRAAPPVSLHRVGP
jgi:hypothetical protein